MVLYNTQARVIGIENVNLFPGSNVLTGENEERLSTKSAQAVIAEYKAAGILNDEGIPAAISKKAKEPDEGKAVTPVDEIRSLSSKDATKLVSTILDRQLLEEILKKDGRVPVQKIAKSQIEKIDSMAKKPE